MHSKETKHKALIHYLHFTRSLRRVSSVYGVGKSTLGRWIKAEGRSRGETLGRKTPMHRLLAEKVGSILERNPFFKGHDVVAELRRQGIKASEATVCRSRSAAGYSRKRVRSKFRPRPPSAEGAREYLDALDRAPEALAVDETCIYFEEAPRYGYSRKGERCVYRRRQPQRTGKVTLVLAISERRGVVAYRVVKGSVNAAAFASFVDSLDAPRGSVAILDNVSFHKSAVVRNAAEVKGIRLVFIPPYSPNFNPIEGTFSVLKSALRSGAEQDLISALEQITAGKCGSFFRASRRYAEGFAAGVIASGGGSRQVPTTGVGSASGGV